MLRLGLTLGETELDGEGDADGLSEGDALRLGETDTDGLSEPLALPADGLGLALSERDCEADGEMLADGVTGGTDGLADALALPIVGYKNQKCSVPPNTLSVHPETTA